MKPVSAPQPSKVLARDVNGPYTLEVVRAAWATLKDVGSWPRPSRALTLWVRVKAEKGAPNPEGKLSLANYLIDGRFTDPNGRQLQAFVLDMVPTIHRSNLPYVPLYNPEKLPAGQSVWRAQNVSPRWKTIRAEWEFLTPGPAVTKKDLPASMFPGTAREEGRLRRFAIILKQEDIEALPKPKTVLKPWQETDLGAVHIQIFPASVRSTKWTRYVRDNKLTGGGEGLEIKIPVVVKGKSPNTLHRWSLLAPGNREWRLEQVSSFGEIERPGGGWLTEDEKTFDLTVSVPKNTDLNGVWKLEGWEVPNRHFVLSPRLEADLTTEVAAPPTPSPTKAEWQVLEARRFDAETPLPERFGAIWRNEGIAVLLRQRAKSPGQKVEAYVRKASDNDGTDLKPSDSKIKFLRREEVEENGAKTQYFVWRALLAPSQKPAPRLSLELQVNDYGVPAISHTFEGLQLQVVVPLR